jgi:hypothetical protein
MRRDYTKSIFWCQNLWSEIIVEYECSRNPESDAEEEAFTQEKEDVFDANLGAKAAAEE